MLLDEAAMERKTAEKQARNVSFCISALMEKDLLEVHRLADTLAVHGNNSRGLGGSHHCTVASDESWERDLKLPLSEGLLHTIWKLLSSQHVKQ